MHGRAHFKTRIPYRVLPAGSASCNTKTHEAKTQQCQGTWLRYLHGAAGYDSQVVITNGIAECSCVVDHYRSDIQCIAQNTHEVGIVRLEVRVEGVVRTQQAVGAVGGDRDAVVTVGVKVVNYVQTKTHDGRLEINGKCATTRVVQEVVGHRMCTLTRADRLG